MNTETYGLYLHLLKFQRNVLLVTTVLCAASLLIMSAFLFQKRERVLVVPPVVDRSFWVDSQGVSSSYLEQFASYMAQLLLSNSPRSAGYQRKAVLEHTSPSFYGALRARLIREEELLMKEQTSYAFYPISIEVDAESLEVCVNGKRELLAMDSKVSTEEESYILQFCYQGGRLLLCALSREEK